MEQSPVTFAVVGAGGRGTSLSEHLRSLSQPARVVAVAEPRDEYREALAREHGIPAERQFRDWRDLAAAPKLADAALVATNDREHREPAVAFMRAGYHLFLEKPMATTLAECEEIASVQRETGAVTAVCHSLRYHKAFRLLKEIVSSGRIGRVVTVDQLEQVAFWHQAHSYVRGNWGNEGRSSFMLLAKSCHDIDYLAHLVGVPCRRVSSFGSLTYFTRAFAPEGSGERCTECAIEPDCRYSAIRQYVHPPRRDRWPAMVASADHSEEAHRRAIETGPYGRCVWKSDNDVVDHQVVAMEFADQTTATFTMTAFTIDGGRKLRVHGTEGEIAFSEAGIEIRCFASGNRETIVPAAEEGGHGGGDARALSGFVRAIVTGDPSHVLTDVQESLATHRIVFAAEQARREASVITLPE